MSRCYRPRSQVAVAAPRRHVRNARRCTLPIHREDTASKRRSEASKREYQKVRLSTTGVGAPPGLTKSASTSNPRTMRTPATVAGSATLELEAFFAEASGPEADCELPAADPFPGVGVVLGNVAFPELGTRGVTLGATVVLGATMFGVPALAAGAVAPAGFEIDV